MLDLAWVRSQMIGLVAIAVLVMSGYGFAAGGVLGALTGLIAAGGAGSGLAIAVGAKDTGTTPVTSRVGAVQRGGGVLTALLTAGLAYMGGWKWGWLWAAAGYAAGMLVTLAVGLLLHGKTS